jgi:hypothetical protein
MTAIDVPGEAGRHPMIFLLGPPGAGKTTLGGRACKELGLRFRDLASAPGTAPAGQDDLKRLSRLVADRAADVIELPWQLQQERKAQVLARRSGVPLLLWAHPEEMQARSGRAEPLFTPVPGLKIRGGFGRTATGCREFRRLHRACGETLLLVDLPLEEAAQVVKARIAEIREEYDASPAEREGLEGWVDDWRQDHNASPRVTRVIVDAMARYLAHLRAGGCSPRTISGVRSALNAAGHLVLMYDAPQGKRILEPFSGPRWESEFKSKFTDSAAQVNRYRRSLEGFASFLKECGDLPKDDEQEAQGDSSTSSSYAPRSRPRPSRRRRATETG